MIYQYLIISQITYIIISVYVTVCIIDETITIINSLCGFLKCSINN